MLSINSRTFNAAGKRVTVRAIQPQRPTGLMSVGWKWPGYDVNVTVDGVKYLRIGHLMVRLSGNFALSLSSREGLWNHLNSLNADDCAKAGLTPWSYKTADFALTHLADFIKCEMEGTRFVP